MGIGSIQTSRLRHNQYQTGSVILFESEKRVALVDILQYHTIMKKTATGELNKKTFRKLKEVEILYKLIHKYKLREEAYKALLKIYIKTKEKT